MAPVQQAPENGEVFTVTGTGLLTLTSPQREARILSISIEKIKLSGKIDYFNFRTPEPASFWGYIQLVRNDTIEELQQLEYRRQSILSIDHYELDPTEQLRCLIKDSTFLLFDNITKLGIAAGLDPAPFGVDRANYALKNEQPRLIPTLSTTGIYYEIPEIYAGQISIIWQGYSLPCTNNSGNQPQSPPRSPGQGQSGGGGNGGGGTRPAIPVPPGRNSDPGSDNPAPPPDSPAGPPSPTPGPSGPLPVGPYRVIVQITNYISGSGPCVINPNSSGLIPYEPVLGPATVQKDNNPGGQGFTWRLYDNNGAIVSNISGSSLFSDCDTNVTITDQIYLGP